MVIEKLSLAGKSADEKPLLATGAAMPLDVMLDLLRDRDGRIEVDIPISGDLGNIDVGLNQLFRQATQAALQKAAFAYVKNALQPLGTILFAANLAGKLSRPRFEPVSFAPGEAEVTGEQARYADKLGTLLAERPELHITLCGVATEDDRQALTPAPEPAQETAPEEPGALDVAPPAAGSEPNTPTGDSSLAEESAQDPATLVTDETLLALARTRADAVKERLRATNGVQDTQLFDCRPSLDADGEARVELTL